MLDILCKILHHWVFMRIIEDEPIMGGLYLSITMAKKD